VIELRSQTGHRRRITPAHSSAQLVSSLCVGAESGIKRTVAHRGSALALTFPRSEPGAEPLPPQEKFQLEENNASRLQLLWVGDPEDWPVNGHRGITQGVLLRRAAQPSDRLSRFLAERSADVVDGTTLHNHDGFLGPEDIYRTRRSGQLSMAARNNSSLMGGDGVKL
jgi:hypothetical protein